MATVAHRVPRPTTTPVALGGLVAAAVLLVLAAAVLHGLAARWHYQDAAHAGRVIRSELPPPLMGVCPVGLDCTGTLTVQDPAVRAVHVEHQADEVRIARLLAGSALVGLLLALWGALAYRNRHPVRAWAVAAGAASTAFLAAGIASRSSLGLFGHVDKVTWPWAAAVSVEVLAVAVLAAIITHPDSRPRAGRP